VRLGALMLLPALMQAQTPTGRHLPWQPALTLPWQALDRQPAVEAFQAPAAKGPLRVGLIPDGVIRVWDVKGLVRTTVGLPGRPRRIWRDGGVPLELTSGPWVFPDQTPLAEGAGGIAWGAADLRPSLSGLLWVIEDGERILTVLHPALGRAIHLALPAVEEAELAFAPDRLVLRGLAEGRPAAWSLPWVALLPALTQLGSKPTTLKLGTATNPFPN
jgi:hypothetical protein